MKRFIHLLAFSFLFSIGSSTNCFATVYNNTAGDPDFSLNREPYDTISNMDYFVFNPTGIPGPSPSGETNNKGLVSWSHLLPSDFGFLISGELEIRAFDVDLSDKIYVSALVNGITYSTRELDNVGRNNTIGAYEWETESLMRTSAAVDRTGVPLWVTSTFLLPQNLIDAINSSTLSSLDFFILNTDTAGWGAVIDYASISLTYDPVPEPATMLLFGSGLLGLIGFRQRKKDLK